MKNHQNRPILQLVEGGTEMATLQTTTAVAAEALGVLAVMLPPDDYLRQAVDALLRCLASRLQQAHAR